MRIQHNIAALNSHRNLTNNNTAVGKNLEKLSSGYRINRAGDDAAGLAISEKMRAQITGLQTAQKNAEDGVSLVQTAEGALTEVHSMLNRMVELATQSANGTYSASNRAEMQKEIDALTSEIDRISATANFNGTKLFEGDKELELKISVSKASDPNAKLTTATATTTDDVYTTEVVEREVVDLETALNGTSFTYGDTVSIGGTTFKFVQTADGDVKNQFAVSGKSSSGTDKVAALKTAAEKFGITLEKSNDTKTQKDKYHATGEGAKVTLHAGETSDFKNKLEVGIRKLDVDNLQLKDLDITTSKSATAAIDIINSAIDTISSTRSDLGALQNRLEHTINNLGVQNENITAAESRIRDVDMAKEMMSYTKNNILVQASQAMLAQANQQPQGVLQLLQ